MNRRAVRHEGRAFIRGRPVTLDRQHSWHFTELRVEGTITEALARARAHDIARRTGRNELNNLLAMVGKPLEVLFT